MVQSTHKSLAFLDPSLQGEAATPSLGIPLSHATGSIPTSLNTFSYLTTRSASIAHKQDWSPDPLYTQCLAIGV